MRRISLLLIYFLFLPDTRGQELKIVMPIGHLKGVYSAAFSRDDQLVVTTSTDGPAKIWDAQTGTLLAEITEGKNKILLACFTNDASKTITVSGSTYFGSTEAKICTIWNTVDGSLIKTLINSAPSEIVGLSVSADNRLLCLYKNGSADVWDIETTQRLFGFEKDSTTIDFAAFSANGKFIYALDYLGVLESRSSNDGKIIKTYNKNFRDFTLAVKISNIDKLVTVVGDNIHITDLTAGTTKTHVKSFAAKIVAITLHPDNQEIIALGDDGIAYCVDLNTGKHKNQITPHDKNVYRIFSSYDGSKHLFASGYFNSIPEIWGGPKNQFMYKLEGATAGISTTLFSADGKRALMATFDNSAKIWNLETARLLTSLSAHRSVVTHASFTPDHQKVLTAGDHSAKIWDLRSGQVTTELKDLNHPVTYSSFNSDATKVIAGYFGEYNTSRTFKLWNTSTGEMMEDISASVNATKKPIFDGDDKVALTWLTEDANTLMGLASGELRDYIYRNLDNIKLSKTDRKAGKTLLLTRNSTATYWDINSVKMLSRFRVDPAAEYEDVNFQSNYLAVNINSQTVLFDLKTGKELVRLINFKKTDFLSIIPSGYYQGTQDAARQLKYVDSARGVVSFEQLDLKFNRPDKVLEAIGCPDTALIRAYRKAYEKRLKRLGVDTTSFNENYSLPQIQAAFNQSNDSLQIRVQASTPMSTLDRLNIWINEVPVYGMRNISLKGNSNARIDTSITVALSSGKNIVEISVTNASGIESYRKSKIINYSGSANQEKVWFIGIGIDSFKQAGNNLRWSVGDIKNILKAFGAKYKTKLHPRILLNRDVTAANVEALKKLLLDSTGIDDKVIIVYSGHGLLSKGFDYFLSSYDVDFNHPEKQGIAYELLENLVDSIPARKRLILLDACHSGEIDKEEMALLKSRERLLANGVTAMKGVSVSNTAANSELSLEGSFDLMQQLFANVSRRTGAVIISAASGTQMALEDNTIRGGVFSYCILEKLQDGTSVDVNQLKEYVGKRVTELTSGLQVPTARSTANYNNWLIW